MVTAFALFLTASIGVVIWVISRWVDDSGDGAVAKDKVESLHKAIDEAEDAQKTRDEISRDYATGKPRRMQGKYDID